MERRESPRVSLAGRPPIRAAVSIDGVMVPTAVSPYDLSRSGMRGRFDSELPEGANFPLQLELAGAVRFTARVAWQRRLPRNAALAGINFVRPSKAAAAAVDRYLESVQQESRRADRRVDDVLPLEIIRERSDESFTSIATNLSRSGLQVINDFELPLDEPLTILLPLAWAPPLELAVQVRWQKKTVFGGYDAGLHFVDPPAAVHKALDAYLKPISEIPQSRM